MKNKFCFLIFLLVLFISCDKECNCDRVVYESNSENNYIPTETDRASSNYCETDTMSSAYLDNEGSIVYVSTIIECQ